MYGCLTWVMVSSKNLKYSRIFMRTAERTLKIIYYWVIVYSGKDSTPDTCVFLINWLILTVCKSDVGYIMPRKLLSLYVHIYIFVVYFFAYSPLK